jgi:DNA-binding response OmpR family regulator
VGPTDVAPSIDVPDGLAAGAMAAGRLVPNIYLVSASPVMRHSLECLFRALGHEVRSFATAGRLLADPPGDRGCICIDGQGLDLPLAICLRLLREQRCCLPVVLLTCRLPDGHDAALGRLYAPLQVLTMPVSGRRMLEAVDGLKRGARQARY